MTEERQEMLFGVLPKSKFRRMMDGGRGAGAAAGVGGAGGSSELGMCYHCGNLIGDHVTYCHTCYDVRSESDYRNEQRWADGATWRVISCSWWPICRRNEPPASGLTIRCYLSGRCSWKASRSPVFSNMSWRRRRVLSYVLLMCLPQPCALFCSTSTQGIMTRK